jgi:hypothetical protein
MYPRSMGETAATAANATEVDLETNSLAIGRLIYRAWCDAHAPRATASPAPPNLLAAVDRKWSA